MCPAERFVVNENFFSAKASQLKPANFFQLQTVTSKADKKPVKLKFNFQLDIQLRQLHFESFELSFGLENKIQFFSFPLFGKAVFPILQKHICICSYRTNQPKLQVQKSFCPTLIKRCSRAAYLCAWAPPQKARFTVRLCRY